MPQSPRPLIAPPTAGGLGSGLTPEELDKLLGESGGQRVTVQVPLGAGLTPEELKQLQTEPARAGAPRTAAQRFGDQFGPHVDPIAIGRGLIDQFVMRPAMGAREVATRLAAGDVIGAHDAAIRGTPILGSEAERIAKLWRTDTGRGAADTTLKAIESIPLVGPTLMTIGERSNAHDYAGAAGAAAGLMTDVAGPEAAMKIAGKAATAAGRAGVRLQISPSITDEARIMTGHGPNAPVNGKPPSKPWQAADRQLVDTAVAERALPPVLNPRANPVTRPMMDSESQVRAGLAQPGASGKPLGTLPFPVRQAKGQPNLIGNRFVRAEWDRANVLQPQDATVAKNAARPHVTGVVGDLPRTLVQKADQVAGSRPLYVGQSRLGPSAAGPRMARAVEQGSRDTIADVLRQEGSPAATQVAAELDRQMRLAALEQVYERIEPAVSPEGVPTMSARQGIALVNRAATPVNRTLLGSGDFLTAAGTHAPSALLRRAILAGLQAQAPAR